MTYLGVWCPECHQDALPLDPHGICGFCDTVIVDSNGKPLHKRTGRPPGYAPTYKPLDHVKSHGRAAYVNDGCRCDRCRSDHTAYQRRWRQAKRKEAA